MDVEDVVERLQEDPRHDGFSSPNNWGDVSLQKWEGDGFLDDLLYVYWIFLTWDFFLSCWKQRVMDFFLLCWRVKRRFYFTSIINWTLIAKDSCNLVIWFWWCAFCCETSTNLYHRITWLGHHRPCSSDYEGGVTAWLHQERWKRTKGCAELTYTKASKHKNMRCSVP